MHPTYPHTLEHVLLVAPSKELETLSVMTKKRFEQMVFGLRHEFPHFWQYMYWVSTDPERNGALTVHQLLVRLCVVIYMEQRNEQARTIRALAVIPPLCDRILNRPPAGYAKVASFYIEELDRLVKSAYPDIIETHQ